MEMNSGVKNSLNPFSALKSLFSCSSAFVRRENRLIKDSFDLAQIANAYSRLGLKGACWPKDPGKGNGSTVFHFSTPTERSLLSEKKYLKVL